MSEWRLHDSDTLPHEATGTGFGAHRLPRWREAIRAFGAGLVPCAFPRLGAIVGWPIWRLSLVGWRGPVDLEPWPGFRLRLYPRQNHADAKCYARPGLVAPSEEAALARCAASAPDGTVHVVDVGANTGTYSILAASLARQAGRSVRLVCIEANPVTQQRLAVNLALSGLSAQADIARCAVSDRSGTVLLEPSVWNLGSVSVRDASSRRMASGARTVPADTLAGIVARAGLPRIDLLKIDIEGHEVPALGPFLRDADPALFPRMILAETKHDRDHALANLLIGAGYRPTLHGRSDTVFER